MKKTREILWPNNARPSGAGDLQTGKETSEPEGSLQKGDVTRRNGGARRRKVRDTPNETVVEYRRIKNDREGEKKEKGKKCGKEKNC